MPGLAWTLPPGDSSGLWGEGEAAQRSPGCFQCMITVKGGQHFQFVLHHCEIVYDKIERSPGHISDARPGLFPRCDCLHVTSCVSSHIYMHIFVLSCNILYTKRVLCK